jgi:hypothetical protein
MWLRRVPRFSSLMRCSTLCKKAPHVCPAKGMEAARDEARAWFGFSEGKDKEAVGLLRPVAENILRRERATWNSRHVRCWATCCWR